MSHELLRARLLVTFDMLEEGIDLMRHRLEREHPGETAEQIEARVREWLRHRPGAEHGDAVGRPGTWPRGPGR